MFGCASSHSTDFARHCPLNGSETSHPEINVVRNSTLQKRGGGEEGDQREHDASDVVETRLMGEGRRRARCGRMGLRL
eukprot:3932871-Rhodomonas_salina.1